MNMCVANPQFSLLVWIRPTEIGNLIFFVFGMLLWVSALFALFWFGTRAVFGRRPSGVRHKRASRRSRALGGWWNRTDIGRN